MPKAIHLKTSKPTIKQVAQESGVSIATVSAVVHGAEWVSEETRMRVQRAIDALDYRPNRAARSLKTRTSDTAGVVIGDLMEPTLASILVHFGRLMRERGHRVMLFDSSRDLESGSVNLRMVLESEVDAVVLIGHAVSRDALRDAMEHETPGPIIAVAHDYDVEGVHTLLADVEQAAFDGTTHLLKSSRRCVALILPSSDVDANHSREQLVAGYERALTTEGLALDRSLEFECADGDGRTAMCSLLEHRERPDAVLAYSAIAALGATRVVLEAGLAVPADVAFIGIGDLATAAQAYPPLSTITVSPEPLGEAAARLVLESNLEKQNAVRRLFAPQLVVRASCGAGPAVHDSVAL